LFATSLLAVGLVFFTSMPSTRAQDAPVQATPARDRPAQPQAAQDRPAQPRPVRDVPSPPPRAAPAPAPGGEPQPGSDRSQLEDVLAYANMLFSRDQFGLAAQQYQVFIRENPESPNLQVAWFRLGECYLEVDQVEDARTSFDYLIENFQKGPFVGSAAYRLAVLEFNQQNYRNAVGYFQVARDELSEPKAKLQARFYRARCLQLTQQPEEALAAFEAVLDAAPPEENPFHERCLLESARLAYDLGKTQEALDRFTELAESAESKEYREEAVVRGGLLAAEAGEIELSEELLDRASDFSDTSPWKSLARVGAIFNAFSRGDYGRVIGLYNSGGYAESGESRAKMLLIVGHSYRLEGDLESALRLYSLVESKFPERQEGIEAGYRKLQVLHQQGHSDLPKAATAYAEKVRRTDPSHSYIDMAWLMKAEWHFAKAENSVGGTRSDYARKNYGDAAAAYAKVRSEKIDEKYRAVRLYKQGWSEIESGNRQDGLETLTRFIEQHPESDLASSALAKRAQAYQPQGDHQFALGDYQSIVKRHPQSPEVEFAMQQVALIHAHQRNTPKMIEAFRNLLDRFPETDNAGEAHYWIGVGHFDQERYAEAAPALANARELAPGDYEDKATLRLAICHYHLENIDSLAKNVRRYLENAPEEEAEAPAEDDAPAKKKRSSIPPQVIEYLGRKLAAEEDYEGAEYFLSHLCDPEKPGQVAGSVWKLLARARMELKKHREAIGTWDQFLALTERPSEKASAYLQRGRAQYCLRDFEAARNSARESLRTQKEGRTNAEARILLGDIAAENGNLEEAAREYLVVSQIFMDPEVTPRSLTKAANAFRSLGNREKAEELMQQLEAKFPDYAPPENLDYEC